MRKVTGSDRYSTPLPFRRVESVRLVSTDGRTTAEAVVVLHRLPRTVPISLVTAERLIAGGTPVHLVDGAPAVTL